jgi:hypothetical protein
MWTMTIDDGRAYLIARTFTGAPVASLTFSGAAA